MKKSSKFTIPGLFGDLHVIIISRRTLLKKAGGSSKGFIINGLYINVDSTIYIASELSPNAKVSTFWHEIAHHLRDSTSEIEDEAACDILGGYLGKLQYSQEVTDFINYCINS